MEEWPLPPLGRSEKKWGNLVSQTLQAMAVLLPAFILFGAAVWALWRPPAVRPSVFLSEAALYFGFAGLFSLAYPWFSLGYLARTTTLVLYASAGLARAFLAVAAQFDWR